VTHPSLIRVISFGVERYLRSLSPQDNRCLLGVVLTSFPAWFQKNPAADNLIRELRDSLPRRIQKLIIPHARIPGIRFSWIENKTDIIP
jgi:hypothetical protein